MLISILRTYVVKPRLKFNTIGGWWVKKGGGGYKWNILLPRRLHWKPVQYCDPDRFCYANLISPLSFDSCMIWFNKLPQNILSDILPTSIDYSIRKTTYSITQLEAGDGKHWPWHTKLTSVYLYLQVRSNANNCWFARSALISLHRRTTGIIACVCCE